MSIDIPLDDAAVIRRLTARTVNDVALTREGAKLVMDTMRYGSDVDNPERTPQAFHTAPLSDWSKTPLIDRAAMVMQSYVNFAHSQHAHALIADSLVAIAFGQKTFKELTDKVTPEYCDPHSDKQSEIKKCVDTWGIPTPAQFIFGRSYEGVTGVTGGATNDIRRMIAQERMLVVPKGLRVAIVTDYPLAYTLTIDKTPNVLDEYSSDNTFTFYSRKAINSLIESDDLTSVIWDSPEDLDSFNRITAPTKVIISESAEMVKSVDPTYLLVTELNEIYGAAFFDVFPVLKNNHMNLVAQPIEGDALFHITHSSGHPQRTIGYPWMPETTKALYAPENNNPSFWSRIFKRV